MGTSEERERLVLRSWVTRRTGRVLTTGNMSQVETSTETMGQLETWGSHRDRYLDYGELGIS